MVLPFAPSCGVQSARGQNGGDSLFAKRLCLDIEVDVIPLNRKPRLIQHYWIFHISADEFCDAPQKALLNVQRVHCERFSQVMGRYYHSRA